MSDLVAKQGIVKVKTPNIAVNRLASVQLTVMKTFIQGDLPFPQLQFQLKSEILKWFLAILNAQVVLVDQGLLSSLEEVVTFLIFVTNLESFFFSYLGKERRA